MKILSVIVPCYNSAEYMERCINSLLLGRENIEIILVDDGSTDDTASIVDYYVQEFPQLIKGVHQDNGGHGAAINTGLAHATGMYVKVVDSDDWLDAKAYKKVLEYLLNLEKTHKKIDMLISNFIYDKQDTRHKKTMQYSSFLPQKRLFSWNNVSFPFGKYLLMHSVIYRRSLLTEQVKLKLPKHTFYVDDLYVFEPLPFVNKMYYLDVNLYHYFIGREDQSVNEKMMIKRIDQQLKVNKRLVEYYTAHRQLGTSLDKYMEKYVEIITTISSILLIKEGTMKSLYLKDQLWNFIAAHDEYLYKKLRRGALGIGLHLPGPLGRKTAVGAYRIARKIYGFN